MYMISKIILYIKSNIDVKNILALCPILFLIHLIIDNNYKHKLINVKLFWFIYKINNTYFYYCILNIDL